jgi:hypothetical protein
LIYICRIKDDGFGGPFNQIGVFGSLLAQGVKQLGAVFRDRWWWAERQWRRACGWWRHLGQSINPLWFKAERRISKRRA